MRRLLKRAAAMSAGTARATQRNRRAPPAPHTASESAAPFGQLLFNINHLVTMIERPKSFDFYDFQTLQIGGFHALLVAKLERGPHIGLISKLVEFCPHRVASRRPSVAPIFAKTAKLLIC